MGLERREDKLKERPIVLRKRRERIKSEANWSLFYYKFTQDHALPNLIWNHKVSAASCGCMRKVTVKLFMCLTRRLLMSYIYGAPSKARNANVVYIWTYVWQR